MPKIFEAEAEAQEKADAQVQEQRQRSNDLSFNTSSFKYKRLKMDLMFIINPLLFSGVRLPPGKVSGNYAYLGVSARHMN